MDPNYPYQTTEKKRRKELQNYFSYISSNGKPYSSKSTKIFQSNFEVQNTFTYLLLKYLFSIKNNAVITLRHFLETKEATIPLINKEENGSLLSFGEIKCNSSYPPMYRTQILYEGSTKKVNSSCGESFKSSYDSSLKTFGEYLERSTSLKPFPFKKKTRYPLQKVLMKYSFLPKPLSFQKIPNIPLQDNDLQNGGVCTADNATRHKKELLPSSCFNHSIDRSKDIFFNEITTNGAGGGITEENAKLSALYELIERDHFLLFWLSGIHPNQIDINTLPEEEKNYYGYITRRYRLELFILDTSYDTDVFSCVVVLIDPILHKLSMGGAAGIDVDNIIRKAYSEALSVIHSSNEIEHSSFSMKTIASYKPFLDSSLNKKKRVVFYNNKEGVEFFKNNFLLGKIISIIDVSKKIHKNQNTKKVELINLINTFKNLTKEKGDGYNLYFYQYREKILDDYNYYVFKAFVPSFYKLWLHENLATPWSERLIEFSKSHGKIVTNEKDINPYPHPFP